ncbi:MAG: type I methionyl aminopeptidase, partial [Candidatus Woesebacteria bacterium]|nr:type I methionyl aminopeptidase [Candidatus Woesebacteria bacterium]
NFLAEAVKIGVRASEIEEIAVKLIKEEGAEASFKKVPGYHWATCVNVNSGLVHGIPVSSLIFKKGDIVSIDVGVYYKGFHTDTSISVGIDLTPENRKFLNTGRETLAKAIKAVKEGNYIYDISKAIEDTIEAAGYTTIKALVGHGVGRELHEEPQIPCFLPFDSVQGKPGPRQGSPQIKKGMVLAVEVMYAQGSDKVEVLEDGWTIAMRDGKISGLFEDTVAVTEVGPKVLTR